MCFWINSIIMLLGKMKVKIFHQNVQMNAAKTNGLHNAAPKSHFISKVTILLNITVCQKMLFSILKKSILALLMHNWNVEKKKEKKIN